MKYTFALILVLVVAVGRMSCGSSATPTPNPVPKGRTPVVGYILVCERGGKDVLEYSVVRADDVTDWPPVEVCR